MTVLDEEKKKRRIVRTIKKRLKIKSQSRTEYVKRIVETYFGKVDFGDIYYRMMDWCEEKNVEPNLRRYDNWLRKGIEFAKDREDKEFDLDKHERAQTKKILKEYS